MAQNIHSYIYIHLHILRVWNGKGAWVLASVVTIPKFQNSQFSRQCRDSPGHAVSGATAHVGTQTQPIRFGTLEWRGRMRIDAVHLWWRQTVGVRHSNLYPRATGQDGTDPNWCYTWSQKESWRHPWEEPNCTSLSKSPFSLRRIDTEGWNGVDDPYLKRVHVEAKVREWVPPNRFGEIIYEPEKSGDEHENPLFHPKCRSHSDFYTIRTSTRLKAPSFLMSGNSGLMVVLIFFIQPALFSTFLSIHDVYISR